MDIQLQELIDKIKKDGIESASEEASRIKTQAEAEAKRIVDAAGREGEAVISRAKAEAEKFEKAGIAALEQAFRNLALAFKIEIQSLLDKIVARETASAYGEDTLKAILPDLVKAWASKGSDSGNQDSLNVILSEGDLKKLQGFFSDKLSQEIKKGVELKANRNLGAGFRIASKDGSAYYDFSSESVAELLAAYLKSQLSEIIKTSAKGK
jgi:V/A-type H+-transporting ATPase subunit E